MLTRSHFWLLTIIPRTRLHTLRLQSRLQASFCEQRIVSVAHGLCHSTFFLFITTTALVTKAWFHCVAAAFGDPAPAQTVAGLMLPMLVLYTGYTIPGPSMVAVDLVHQPDPVRLRGAYVQRVSYTQRNMLKTHSEWYQICKRVSHEPGMGDCRLNLRPKSHGWKIVLSQSHTTIPTVISGSFGIIIGFGIAFVTAFLFFVEYNTSVSGETSATLFKRGAKAPVVREAQGKADTVDEEKGVPESRDAMEKIRGESGLYSMDVAVPMMLDVFTWSTMFEWVKARPVVILHRASSQRIWSRKVHSKYSSANLRISFLLRSPS
ncbi:hypothetical protein EDB83DRAFT_1932551 [Lactarius deliciosus]|nr:hypothetical protein EDB83DRAFT_1932551 [Lactarius deliciosus]